MKGEGIVEDCACFCGGDGWFPQLLKMIEGGEGKLELFEIFVRVMSCGACRSCCR